MFVPGTRGRKVFAVTSLVLAALFFLCFAVHFSCPVFHNLSWRSDFESNGKDELYNTGVPMEEMKLSGIRGLFPFTSAEALTQDANARETVYEMELPGDVHYYTHLGDERPALTLPQGTRVFWARDGKWSTYSSVGYGVVSYPSYDKGWRYTRPFQTVDEDEKSETYYYVRLEELEQAAEEVMRINDRLRKNYGGDVAAWTLTRTVDDMLHAYGVYLSPDLMREVFTAADAALLGASLLFLLLFLVLRRPPRGRVHHKARGDYSRPPEQAAH